MSQKNVVSILFDPKCPPPSERSHQCWNPCASWLARYLGTLSNKILDAFAREGVRVLRVTLCCGKGSESLRLTISSGWRTNIREPGAASAAASRTLCLPLLRGNQRREPGEHASRADLSRPRRRRRDHDGEDHARPVRFFSCSTARCDFVLHPVRFVKETLLQMSNIPTGHRAVKSPASDLPLELLSPRRPCSGAYQISTSRSFSHSLEPVHERFVLRRVADETALKWAVPRRDPFVKGIGLGLNAPNEHLLNQGIDRCSRARIHPEFFRLI